MARIMAAVILIGAFACNVGHAGAEQPLHSGARQHAAATRLAMREPAASAQHVALLSDALPDSPAITEQRVPALEPAEPQSKGWMLLMAAAGAMALGMRRRQAY